MLCSDNVNNVLLDKYTTWKVGGPAKYFYQPADVKDLASFLRQQFARGGQREPLLWLGLGSNLLIRDGGFVGTVIQYSKMQSRLFVVDDNYRAGAVVHAEAGITCAKLARFLAQHALSGGEFFAGIPGTVGGALAMNAGAFGSETWRHVIALTTIDRAGKIITRSPGDFTVSYRRVVRPNDEWFIGANFYFAYGSQVTAQSALRTILKLRNFSQPIGVFSCGSVFRNPPGGYAAQLIEASKLKGMSIGDAVVSVKHANFIINRGSASAADIEELLNYVKRRVWLDHKISLIPEVHIVGEKL